MLEPAASKARRNAFADGRQSPVTKDVKPFSEQARENGRGAIEGTRISR